MTHLLKAASVGVEMLARRDFLRRLFGDRYAAQTKVVRELLRNVAKRDGKGILDAALTICKEAESTQPDCINTIIAAAVDLIEEGAS